MNSGASASQRARRLAALATASFAVWAAAVALRRVSDAAAALPLLLFYAVLLVNTYYSIRCFAALIPPDNRAQQVVDAALVVLYFVMPVSFNNPTQFTLVATILFAVATLKYLLLAGVISDRWLLRRKIIADGLGTAAALLALASAWAGFPRLSTYLWSGAFALANIYLLLINPLYRLSTPTLPLKQLANREKIP